MNQIIIGDFTLYQLITYFFVYSFLGWCTEVIFATLKTGKFINRGFLNGPVCPIYGTGMVIVLLILSPLIDKIGWLFIASIGLTTTLEFITGFIMEKIFHQKWWDYSKEPFNLMGYVCLRFAILWGLGCLLIMKVIQPEISKIINLLPSNIGIYIIYTLIIIFLFDIILTVLQLVEHGKKMTILAKLSTDMRIPSNAIGETVSKVTITVKDEYDKGIAKLKKSRFVKAFPTLNIEEIINKINKRKNH